MKEIQEYAFAESDIEKITLPSTLKIIGKGAFSGCTKLSSITIPDGVRRIEEKAFEECGLEEVDLSRQLKFIGKKAFSYCIYLKKVNLPEGNHPKIGTEAFAGCKELIDEDGFVIIHNKIVYFGKEQVESPLYVTIPDHVTAIEEKIFSRYPVVHLTMSLDCPSWPVYEEDYWTTESIITNDGCTISFRDADGKTAAKVILAIKDESWQETAVIASVRCKQTGGFDFDEYDRAFSKLEKPRNKTAMALIRLLYPYELSDTAKERYVSYLQGNILDVLTVIFDAEQSILGMEDMEILKVLEKETILEEDVIPDLIEYAQIESRNDFALELLEYRNKKFGVKNVLEDLQLSEDEE